MSDIYRVDTYYVNTTHGHYTYVVLGYSDIVWNEEGKERKWKVR